MSELERIECGACNATTNARPPEKAFWALIVGFWVASLVLGIATSALAGWAFVMVVVWATLATTVFLLARRATTWTCEECGSSVPPPLGATLRGGHYRHV